MSLQQISVDGALATCCTLAPEWIVGRDEDSATLGADTQLSNRGIRTALPRGVHCQEALRQLHPAYVEHNLQRIGHPKPKSQVANDETRPTCPLPSLIDSARTDS